MKILLIMACVLFSFGGIAGETAPQTPKTYLWVIAHEPIDLFKAAADQFSNEIAEKTHGNIKINVMTLPEYAKVYNAGKEISPDQFLKIVQEGKIQFSQTYTTELGRYSPDMYVLDLPFLFRSHEHAKHVLEGKVGEQLLASVTSEHVRGLAFTYSGGYRILPSKKKIAKLEDFKGMRIRTSGSPVAQATFKALGAEPVVMGLNQIGDSMKDGDIVAGESTYARF